MKAIVFDDEPTIRALLCELLGFRGYQVSAFPSPPSPDCRRRGDQTCPQPENQPCADVILTDLEMPTRSGLNYMEEQLQHGCKCRHIALITGSGSKKDFDHAQRLGIKTFLKPLEVKELLDWLTEAETALRESIHHSDS